MWGRDVEPKDIEQAVMQSTGRVVRCWSEKAPVSGLIRFKVLDEDTNLLPPEEAERYVIGMDSMLSEQFNMNLRGSKPSLDRVLRFVARASDGKYCVSDMKGGVRWDHDADVLNQSNLL
jgi:hypothetical protein